ncbi:MAG: MFS transporter [Terracidiphilus sp.]
MTASSIASKERSIRRHPAAWVPTLYFAEGLPYWAVSYLALIFYQAMGVRNANTTLIVSLLALPWTLKPIWSPMLEMYKTKKFFAVGTQLVGGLSLVLIALSLNLPGYFRYSIALLAVLGFCSATHDIAADGIYIAALTSKQQAAYVGLQGGCYNLARIFCTSALIWLIGILADRFARAHAANPVVHAWMVAFGIVGLLLIAIGLYHLRMLPTGGEQRETESLRQMALTFWDVVVCFFKKPNIYLLLIFIFLYRAGEGQVTKVGPLFLRAARSTGGLGLSLQEFGTVGFFGSLSFFAGSLLGGFFISRLSLKRALPWLILALNLPMLAYWYLSVALPTNLILVSTAMSVEMFGYGFGFVGVILLMMQEIAPGKYQTAHYAFANSLMNLGVILPGAVSGWIQTKLGYTHFFIWVIIAALPALILSRFIPIRGGAQAPPPQIAEAQG